ncbi:MAG: hypothetical protein N3F07_00140 [Candidatus Micrarchaeota archaeon]|nr:hypothetical protein [Candidatus Micrarchaeota archaeon]
MAKVCIICEKEAAQGLVVEDDAVIIAIRKVKNMLGVAKNNQLMVCDLCAESYKRKRESYERNIVIHTIIAALVLLAFILLPLFTSGFSIWSLVMGVVLAGVIMGFSLFSHVPKASQKKNEEPPAKESAGKPAEKPSKERKPKKKRKSKGG